MTSTRRDRVRRRGRPLLVAVAVLTTFACVHVPLNRPLTSPGGPREGHRPRTDGDELFVALSFSGGGTRAAAFSFGVLEALATIEIGPGRTLFDEIDLVTAVSGGAITAAALALDGEEVLTELPAGFLYRNVQGTLLRRALTPRGWWRLAHADFGRVELLAEILDDRLYHGARFRDLEGSGRRPFLLVNATDISSGTRFEFSQDQFDLLCSDLDDYPIARAVAASAAVPVVLSPLTLRNFGWARCGLVPPSWLQPGSAGDGNLRLLRAARSARRLEDPSERTWVHLFDGGLVDNLGLHALLDQLLDPADPCAVLERHGLGHTRSVLLVIVNAVTELDRSADLRREGPTLAQTVWAAANIPIDRFAFQSLDLLDARAAEWSQRLAECPERETTDPIAVRSVVVSFESVADPVQRRRFQTLPTSFRLPSATVDALRRAAADQVTASPEVSALVDEMRADG